MDASSETPLPQFFQALIDELGKPREFTATYSLPKEPGKVENPDSVLASLELNAKILSPVAKEALDALEAANIAAESDWIEFKWKLQAFNYLQDIFDAPLFEGLDIKTIFHQYYFYYESRHLLAESILCGLNGFYTAAHALLRPFLEFSLLQNYYYRLTDQSRSYGALEKYFRSGVTPALGTVLKKALPKDTFSKAIRFRIHSHLTGLSESVLHPYHPDHSTTQHKGSESIHSLEGVHFWHMTKFAVEAALWLYYTNFPLLFHPVPVLRKFGYRLPVGIVIDENGGTVIQKSLTEEDYQRFRAYSLIQERTKGVLEWVKSFPDLSDEEVRGTWDQENGKYPGLWKGYAQTMARMRGLRGSMAFHQRSEDPAPVPQALLDAARSLKGWQKLTAKGFQGKKK
jgi:hypothetical protein